MTRSLYKLRLLIAFAGSLCFLPPGLSIMSYSNSQTLLRPPDGKQISPSGSEQLLNNLMLGCSQEGAINYLLECGGRRVELVYGGLGSPEQVDCEAYDDARILRLGKRRDGTWEQGKVCLFFREGYLVGKCVVSDKDTIDLKEIYRREITSGLQHPPNNRELMKNVHWGKARHPEFHQAISEGTGASDKVGKQTPTEASRPKVRCGITMEGLPPFAKDQGYNVLALFQNVGPSQLNDELLMLGFPIGPVILVSTRYRGSDTMMGFPGPFGIYGTKVVQLRLPEKVLKVRSAPFRLRSGETSFMWFKVDDLESYRSIQAKVTGLWGSDGKRLRVWDVESAEETIKAK